MTHPDSALTDGPVETHHNLVRGRVPVWVWAAFSLLLAGAAFWLIVWWPVVRERRAVTLLETIPGITVSVDDCTVGEDESWQALLSLEGWQHWLLPQPANASVFIYDDFPRDVLPLLRSVRGFSWVDVTHSGLTDKDLKLIPDAEAVLLNLSGSPVTDAGIPHLTRLNGLFKLSLADTRVTGTTLNQLASLPGLTSLDLDGLPVDDRTLSMVAGWPQLTSLGFARTRIADAGLAAFSSARSWVRLDLSNTAVTIAGLKRIHGPCKSLWLNDNLLDDGAVPEILRLAPEFVALERTGITDAGLKELAKLPKLRRLYLAGCNVGNDGVLALLMGNEDRPDLPITERADLLLKKLRSRYTEADPPPIGRAELDGTKVSPELLMHLPKDTAPAYRFCGGGAI